MNLTEVLLSVIIGLAVIASGFFLYATISDRQAASTTMQSISLLRANIEDLYQGDYTNIKTDSESTEGTLYNLGLYPDAITKNQSLATRWGDITLDATDDNAAYTITLTNLSPTACMELGRFQYRSWAKVQVANKDLWTRGQTAPFSSSDLAEQCATGNVAITYTAP